jgi:hypothetical protein
MQQAPSSNDTTRRTRQRGGPRSGGLFSLFRVNTGLREQEVCGLKWDHEVFLDWCQDDWTLIPRRRDHWYRKSYHPR